MRHRVIRTTAATIGAAGIAALAGVAVSAQLTGPATPQSPYALPTVPVVETTSVLSVGDTEGGYRMVGIPDGLGAIDNGDSTFTLVMNHELGNNLGSIRAHGAKGAFVSKWTVDKASLDVLSGIDLMQRIYLWDAVGQQSEQVSTPFAFNRFCSGDLPAASAFYNPATGLGTRERIYLHGEEGGATGYQMGTVVTGPSAGNAYVLGKFNLSTNGSGLAGVGAWENALASPYAQNKTIVIGNNDGGTGIMTNALAVYVGSKQASGSDVDKAGLTNGTLKFVNVTGNAVEIANTTSRATNIASGTRFTLNGTSSTTFSRPEDGAWNPLNPRQYYFVTTDQLDQVTDGVGAQNGRTRLWRLTFDNITNPQLGGIIDLLIDGRVVNGERVNMLDNIAVNEKTGFLMLQEDVGGNAHNGKMWLYDPKGNSLAKISRHDSARFGDIGIAATAPFNQDEESSGIVDMSAILGPGMYLTSEQAHYAINATTPRSFPSPDELVEGGQLVAMRVPFPIAKYRIECKAGGWASAFRQDGGTFASEAECVEYVLTTSGVVAPLPFTPAKTN